MKKVTKTNKSPKSTKENRVLAVKIERPLIVGIMFGLGFLLAQMLFIMLNLFGPMLVSYILSLLNI